jgi:glutaredoxin-like protein NrdH
MRIMSISIYTKENCVQCHATKRMLAQRAIPFTLIDIDTHPECTGWLKSQGFLQLPVVITDTLCWSGFRPDMINRLHSQPGTGA